MSKFYGYRIRSKSMLRIEAILKQARENIHIARTEEYHRLLSEEVTMVVDDIALNVYPRPETTILEFATQRLRERIIRAEQLGLGTAYNLSAGCVLLPDREYTYIILSAANSALRDAFTVTKEIDDFSFETCEPVTDNAMPERALIWEKLQKRYENHDGHIMNASLNKELGEPKVKLLSFESVQDRASRRAIHRITDRLLSMYAGNQAIKPHELMDYMDKALLSLSDYQNEIDAQAGQLASVLPEITEELITAKE